ncbi:Pleiotropic regulator 1 [Cyphomyrmex costatus]|uniref:Pleiotropic regulator 1 n=1 Tax=Cyphomyrmex costatus TaxID=456900 RepID=A0A195CH04_9HYME|nr:Pleiotropic regulator 1 [Cyphomyrmex costatus]
MSNFVPKKEHLREVLLFCFNLKKSAAESHRLLVEAYGEHALSETTCRDWFRKFKNNDFDVNDKKRSGQPKKFEDEELEALLQDDSCQTLKQLSEILNVDVSTVSKRIKIMGMMQNLGNIATDEKWICYDNPKRKKSWVHPSKPSTSMPKQDELLQSSQTINSECYRCQLLNLNRALKERIWDLASGKLKVSLTGHISSVRGLAFSQRHPYLFSCGEDRQVKCWDLEYNKVIRHYHGHLSAVYSMALHPTIDVLVTAGRDSTGRVWDMRTKANVHTLVGHTNTVASVICQSVEPQIISGSHDCTIRLWDLAAGKSRATLTNHKKSVRALTFHPSLYMFASASPDNIKQWKCPEGKFIQNLSGHNAIVNCLAVNADGVLVSGADNGTMHLWDWRTGYNFQRLQAPVQPGSMDSEAGVFSITFDMSGTRMITTEADKTIKVYKEDDTATEETHPVDWRPDIIKRRKY